MKRLATICARGGSKGVKNKNTRMIAGHPLIGFTVRQILASGLFSDLAISSDSDDILNIAKTYGAIHLVKRPAELADDFAAKPPVIRHCVREIEKITGKKFDIFADFDCTSPLRSVSDITESVKTFEAGGQTNLITAAPARRSPYFNLVEIFPDGRVDVAKKLEKPILRRQDSPRCFDMNASIYLWRRDALLNELPLFNEKTMLFEMPEDRSIDIDHEHEFLMVEFLLSRRPELLALMKSEGK